MFTLWQELCHGTQELVNSYCTQVVFHEMFCVAKSRVLQARKNV